MMENCKSKVLKGHKLLSHGNKEKRFLLKHKKLNKKRSLAQKVYFEKCIAGGGT